VNEYQRDFVKGLCVTHSVDPAIRYLEKAGWRYGEGVWNTQMFAPHKLKIDPIRKTFTLLKEDTPIYSNMPLSRLIDKLIEQNIYVQISET
jgi:hypothetical protein